MNKQNQASVEHFDSLLEWLDPNRERAWEKYQGIQQSLVQIFTWKGCSDAESLADETLNQVMSRVSALKGSYEGNPSTYIHAVAKNVLREHMRAQARSVELTDSVPQNQTTTDIDKERMYVCLERCFSNLSPSSRYLIQNYYSWERMETQAYRKKLAEKFDVSPNQLRLRIYRIRNTLKTCIEACMEQEGTNSR